MTTYAVAENAAVIGAYLAEHTDDSPLFYAPDVATLAAALTEREENAPSEAPYAELWNTDYESACCALAGFATEGGKLTLAQARTIVDAVLMGRA